VVEAAQNQPSSLHSRQVLFVSCLAKLFIYAENRGFELTLGEGRILTPRKIRTGAVAEDGVHMPGSLHYVGLAQDLNLFINGEYIRDSDNPAYVELGRFWQSLNPNCAWGGTFKPADGNHFSVRWQGRA
jgi:hypothetical protein